jgi:hypothetical protein
MKTEKTRKPETLSVHSLFKYRKEILLNLTLTGNSESTAKRRINRMFPVLAEVLRGDRYYYRRSFFTINDARILSAALKPLIPSVTIEKVRQLKNDAIIIANKKRESLKYRIKNKYTPYSLSNYPEYFFRIFPLKNDDAYYKHTAKNKGKMILTQIETLLSKYHLSAHEKHNITKDPLDDDE